MKKIAIISILTVCFAFILSTPVYSGGTKYMSSGETFQTSASAWAWFENECTYTNVFVQVTETLIEYNDSGDTFADYGKTAYATIYLYDYCSDESQELSGYVNYLDSDFGYANDGESASIEVEVVVSDENSTMSSVVSFKVQVVADKDGYRGENRNDGKTSGPNGYSYKSKGKSVWADALVSGKIKLDGVSLDMTNASGQISDYGDVYTIKQDSVPFDEKG